MSLKKLIAERKILNGRALTIISVGVSKWLSVFRAKRLANVIWMNAGQFHKYKIYISNTVSIKNSNCYIFS